MQRSSKPHDRSTEASQVRLASMVRLCANNQQKEPKMTRSKVELMDMHKKDRELLNRANQHIQTLKEHIQKQGQELDKTNIDLAGLYIHSKHFRDMVCKHYPSVQQELCSEIAHLDKALETTASTKPGKTNLLALVIDHKYGTDVSIFKTETEALNALYEYVAEYWNDRCDKDDLIENYSRERAIEHYFHEMPFVDEWYVTQDVSIDL